MNFKAHYEDFLVIAEFYKRENHEFVYRFEKEVYDLCYISDLYKTLIKVESEVIHKGIFSEGFYDVDFEFRQSGEDSGIKIKSVIWIYNKSSSSVK